MRQFEPSNGGVSRGLVELPPGSAQPLSVDITTEQGFAAALHRALRDFTRPDSLHHNPLLTAQLVRMKHSDGQAPVQTLRDLICAHCRDIGSSPKTTRYQQVLQLTYLAPLRRQRAVAEAMHLSWSTYRHCLDTAIRMLTASLWEAESVLQQSSRLRPLNLLPTWRWPVLAAVSAVLATAAILVMLWMKPATSSHNITAIRDSARNHQEAHDYYRLGQTYLDQQSLPDSRQAIQYFRESLQLDPDNANSLVALASAYNTLDDSNEDGPPDRYYNTATMLTGKAISLEPDSARAHAMLGLLLMEHWNWHQAKQELDVALQLDPDDAQIRSWYARYCLAEGNIHEAANQIQLAYSLDPLSLGILAESGRILSYDGAPTQADSRFRAALSLAHDSGIVYAYMAESAIASHHFRRALADIHAAEQIPNESISPLLMSERTIAEIGAGYPDMARLQTPGFLKAGLHQHYISGVYLAWIDWTLGNRSKAYADFQRAVRDHDHAILMIRSPAWNSMRTDPRFSRILASANIPAVQHPL